MPSPCSRSFFFWVIPLELCNLCKWRILLFSLVLIYLLTPKKWFLEHDLNVKVIFSPCWFSPKEIEKIELNITTAQNHSPKSRLIFFTISTPAHGASDVCDSERPSTMVPAWNNPAGIYLLKVNKKDTRTTPMASFWCLYSWFWTYFTTCSRVSIVKFEHVITGWSTVLLVSHSTERIHNHCLYLFLFVSNSVSCIPEESSKWPYHLL